MEALRVIPDLTMTGFREGEYAITEYDGQITIGGMPNGTVDGKPVVLIALDDGDGGFLVAQTTLTLFLSAAQALEARHGEDIRS